MSCSREFFKMFAYPFDVTGEEHLDVIFVVISPHLPVIVMKFRCGVRPVSVGSFLRFLVKAFSFSIQFIIADNPFLWSSSLSQ